MDNIEKTQPHLRYLAEATVVETERQEVPGRFARIG
jgi:hypothetical protein